MNDSNKMLLIVLIFALGINIVPVKTHETNTSLDTLTNFPTTFIADLKTYNDNENNTLKVWYDIENNFIRVDSYGGILKLYVEEKEGNRAQWVIFPLQGEEYCYEYPYHPITPEPYFINTTSFLRSNFQHIGKETVRGTNTEKLDNGKGVTIYMKYQKSDKHPNKQIPAPVMITIKAENSLRRIEITSFSDTKPDVECLKKPLKSIPCTRNSTTWNDTYVPLKHQKQFHVPNATYQNLPNSYDLRKLGAVVERKDNCHLEMSWSCAAAAVVEGAYFLYNNRTKLVHLSKQSLMDCSCSRNPTQDKTKRIGEQYAYEWIIQNGGIPEELQYPGPRTGLHEQCKVKNIKSTITIKGWGQVNLQSLSHTENIKSLKASLLHYGPLAVKFQADIKGFVNLTDKIYNDPACGDRNYILTYTALLVGYGKENDTEYWIINPFWGPNFGQDGYLKISTQNNICGIANNATYVIF